MVKYAVFWSSIEVFWVVFLESLIKKNLNIGVIMDLISI